MIRIFSRYVSPKSVLLGGMEGGFIVLGLLFGAKLRFWGAPSEFSEYIRAPGFAIQAAFFVVTLQLCFYYSDLYDWTSVRNRWQQLISVGQSIGAACLFLGIMYFAFPILLIGRGVFFISTMLVAMFALMARMALDVVWIVAAPKQRVIIIGTGRVATTVRQEIVRRSDLNIEVVGFLEPFGAAESADPEVLGSTRDLEKVVERQQISRIVIALEDRRGSLPTRDLVRLRVAGLRVDDAHTALASLSGRIWLDMVHPSWFVFSDGFHRHRLTLVLKRIIDLGFGMLGLALSSPVMLLVALAVRLDSKGPVIFRQTRVGYRGKTFELYKFRSMRVDAEAGGAQWAQKHDTRVTRLGRYLRKYRLDELPQFINVIRGDMSFVGPRPERPIFVERLREVISYYDERHSVRPGLTGWAQVEYSYGSNMDDAIRKMEYDLFYLKNMSLFFDGVIILKTIRIIFSGQGGR